MSVTKRIRYRARNTVCDPAIHHGAGRNLHLPRRIAFLPDGRMLITEKDEALGESIAPKT
jgi:hypothetical protein